MANETALLHRGLAQLTCSRRGRRRSFESSETESGPPGVVPAASRDVPRLRRQRALRRCEHRAGPRPGPGVGLGLVASLGHGPGPARCSSRHDLSGTTSSGQAAVARGERSFCSLPVGGRPTADEAKSSQGGNDHGHADRNAGRDIQPRQHPVSCSAGAETYQQYVSDAEQRGEQDLVQFFREVQEEEKRRSERAKQLLAQRLSAG